MGRLSRQWESPRSLFGDVVVLGFVIAQCLDGVLTYLGVSLWGPGVEANPVVGAVMATVGLGPGLAGTKLVAIGFGIVLHLFRVHNVVALLTAVYIAAAILPWAAMFLTH